MGSFCVLEAPESSVPASLPRPQCGAFLKPFSSQEDPGHCDTSVPGGEGQCLPHQRVPVQDREKVAVPGLEGSQNTGVNNPDLEEKRHGIFNDHK